MDVKVMIRKAERQDVPLLLEFIRGIARFGNLLLQLLLVHRAFRIVSGGLVRMAGISGQGIWEGFAVASGEDCP